MSTGLADALSNGGPRFSRAQTDMEPSGCRRVLPDGATINSLHANVASRFRNMFPNYLQQIRLRRRTPGIQCAKRLAENFDPSVQARCMEGLKS